MGHLVWDTDAVCSTEPKIKLFIVTDTGIYFDWSENWEFLEWLV